MKLLKSVFLVAAMTAAAMAIAYAIEDRLDVRSQWRSDGDFEVVSVDSAGRLHGECRRYSPDGSIKTVSNFHRGTTISFSHYLDGKLLSESTEGDGYAMVTRDY